MNSIAERRKALGMTQGELAERLRAIDGRVDTSMISRFEQESCFPTEDVLEGLERALKADRSELYSDMELFIVPEEKTPISPITGILAELIPFGPGRGISRKELAEKLGTSDRQMREYISTARRQGLVIINDQHGDGYYRSDNIKDLQRQLTQTHRRALSLLAQEKHLKDRIRAVEGGPC